MLQGAVRGQWSKQPKLAHDFLPHNVFPIIANETLWHAIISHASMSAAWHNGIHFILTHHYTMQINTTFTDAFLSDEDTDITECYKEITCFNACLVQMITLPRNLTCHYIKPLHCWDVVYIETCNADIVTSNYFPARKASICLVWYSHIHMCNNAAGTLSDDILVTDKATAIWITLGEISLFSTTLDQG